MIMREDTLDSNTHANHPHEPCMMAVLTPCELPKDTCTRSTHPRWSLGISLLVGGDKAGVGHHAGTCPQIHSLPFSTLFSTEEADLLGMCTQFPHSPTAASKRRSEDGREVGVLISHPHPLYHMGRDLVVAVSTPPWP